jgi:hypothetical protein
MALNRGMYQEGRVSDVAIATPRLQNVLECSKGVRHGTLDDVRDCADPA